MRKLTVVGFALLLTAASTICRAQDDLEPGVERWAIKTSLAANPRSKSSTLDKLLALPNPVNKVKDAPDSERIAKTVGGLKEGDIVTIKGWLLLVALEDDAKKHRDGDYHIQIRPTGDWADSCLVVEIPFPDFIEDADLKDKCSQARQFVKSKLLKNKEPGTAGNKMTHPVFVTITGQLFFDATHLKGNPRGKRGMHSYTCWELHPVTSMAFAPKPQ
jgi:hypothetical protein